MAELLKQATVGEVMRWLLGAIALILVVVMVALHRSKSADRNDFDLTDLIMQNHRIDKVAFVYMVAFAALTWLLLYFGMRDKLTEGFLTAYCTSVFGPIAIKFLGGTVTDIWGKKNGTNGEQGDSPRPPPVGAGQ